MLIVDQNPDNGVHPPTYDMILFIIAFDPLKIRMKCFLMREIASSFQGMVAPNCEVYGDIRENPMVEEDHGTSGFKGLSALATGNLIGKSSKTWIVT